MCNVMLLHIYVARNVSKHLHSVIHVQTRLRTTHYSQYDISCWVQTFALRNARTTRLRTAHDCTRTAHEHTGRTTQTSYTQVRALEVASSSTFVRHRECQLYSWWGVDISVTNDQHLFTTTSVSCIPGGALIQVSRMVLCNLHVREHILQLWSARTFDTDAFQAQIPQLILAFVVCKDIRHGCMSSTDTTVDLSLCSLHDQSTDTTVDPSLFGLQKHSTRMHVKHRY
jgi:hypothetical protein